MPLPRTQAFANALRPPAETWHAPPDPMVIGPDNWGPDARMHGPSMIPVGANEALQPLPPQEHFQAPSMPTKADMYAKALAPNNKASSPQVMPELDDAAFFGPGYEMLSDVERHNVRSFRHSLKKWSRQDVREMATNPWGRFGPLKERGL